MLEKNMTIKLENRSGSSVTYRVEDLGIRRTFQPGEIKEISMEELRKLSYTTGGRVLLQEYLMIKKPEAVEEILTEVEPEYYYTKDDVIKLLKEGSIEQFLDCLDFASEGVLEMVKKYAVDLEVNDVKKRNAIKEKLNFDVTKAIEINKETLEDGKEEAKSQRRSAPINAQEEAKPAPRRRVSTQN